MQSLQVMKAAVTPCVIIVLMGKFNLMLLVFARRMLR